MIGLLGGLVGLGISYIVVLCDQHGHRADKLPRDGFFRRDEGGNSMWVALGALGIALLVGIASGVYPARKATKMSPLEAMRSGN